MSPRVVLWVLGKMFVSWHFKSCKHFLHKFEWGSSGFSKWASFSTVKNEIYATAQLVFEVICPLDDWAAFGDGSSSLQEWFWNTERFWHFNFLLTKKEFSHYVLTFCLFYFFFYCTQIKNEDLMELLNELLLD